MKFTPMDRAEITVFILKLLRSKDKTEKLRAARFLCNKLEINPWQLRELEKENDK